MAMFKFTKAIFEGEPINIFNNGNLSRDFTYIDDLIHYIRLLIDCIPTRAKFIDQNSENDSLSTVAPFRVIKIGNLY